MNIVASDIRSVAKLFKRTFGTPFHRPHMSTHTIAIIEPNNPNRSTHEMIHSSWYDAYE